MTVNLTERELYILVRVAEDAAQKGVLPGYLWDLRDAAKKLHDAHQSLIQNKGKTS